MAAATALVFLASGAGYWAWTHTLEAVDLVRAARLRLAGVRRERAGSLDALVRDRCAPGRPCRCVALVHGLGDYAYTWSGALEAAPEGFRVVAPNMPGSMGSPRPASPGGWKIPAQARTLRAALEARGACARWTVAGNSLGGWTAAWLALQWPEGVEKLVLASPAGLADPTGVSEKSAEALAMATPERLLEFFRRAYHRPREVPPRVLPDAAARILARGTREIAEAIGEEDFLDGKLGALRMPVAVLWGESDRIIPPSQAARFSAEIPHAAVRIEKECGHLPQKECPAPLLREIYGDAPG